MNVLAWLVLGAIAGIGIWKLAGWRSVRPLNCATTGGLGGIFAAAVFTIGSGRSIAGFEALPMAIAAVGGAVLVAVFGLVAERELPGADRNVSSRG
jgi:hypothetical protein